MRRFSVRLARLEARRPPVPAPPSEPPELPPGYVEEVLRLLHEYNQLGCVLRSLGASEADIAALAETLEERLEASHDASRDG